MHVGAAHFSISNSSPRHISTAQSAANAGQSSIPVVQLQFVIDDWLNDCQGRQQSERTIELRRMLLGRLQWFLEQRGCQECGKRELRLFFSYITTAWQNPEGRWGEGAARHGKKEIRPVTVLTYFAHFRSFFKWLEGEEYVDVSPMARMAPPAVRPDQVRPFTEEQVDLLLLACRHSPYPRRDEAIVWMLFDTGMRASELVNLKMRDLNLFAKEARILGKGNKERTISFGRNARRALRRYLRDAGRLPEEPVFIAERGWHSGQALTTSGLRQIIVNLGKNAGITGVRCSPHTFRHTFAVTWLRRGGDVFSLKEMMGHTQLSQTDKYVAFARADVAAKHRQFSPGDGLKR